LSFLQRLVGIVLPWWTLMAYAWHPGFGFSAFVGNNGTVVVVEAKNGGDDAFIY
jgi:hypothetical protein